MKCVDFVREVWMAEGPGTHEYDLIFHPALQHYLHLTQEKQFANIEAAISVFEKG